MTLVLAFGFSYFAAGQGCDEPTSDGINIIGYIQPEWRYGFYNDPDNGIEDENSFYFRRARLGVTGKIPYDFSYYAVAELSPFLGGPYLLDAFVTWERFGPYFKVSMGQFKSQFGLELVTPCFALHTIERSKFVNELAHPFRDLGILLSGSTGDLEIIGLKNTKIIQYSLGITNGTGLNKWDNNQYKDVTARMVLAPWEFIAVGGSYRYGKQKNPDDLITEPDIRRRWGMDIALHFFNFIVEGEYINGYDKGSKTVGGGCGEDPEVIPGTFNSDGYAVMALYTTPWKLQPLIKYETYDPDKDLAEEAPAGYRESTITFGLNWFPNDWSRVQINYRYNTESSSSSDASMYNEYPNDMLMVQVQAKFN